MNLETARHHLRTCRERMDALYQKPVFDEWVVISQAQGKVFLLVYDGTRPEKFVDQFHADSGPLWAEMEGKHYAVGDFEFVQDAKATRFDACVRLGGSTYLLCNNTYGSLADIRRDPRWLRAQAPFVELTEKFRADPLAVA